MLTIHFRRAAAVTPVTASIDCAAKIIGEHIRNRKLQDPFNARDVYRTCWGGIGDQDNVMLALEFLEDLDWIKAETIPPTVMGGRPTVRYHINPRLHP